MREVEVSRVIPAGPRTVEARLTPATLVEYEGSFTVRDVEERDGTTLVLAGASGLELALRFEERDGAIYYTQEGDAGPFESMETWVSYDPENEGTRVTVRSAVALGLPPAVLTDRVAAWKRRGELRRALAALAADV